MPKATTGYSRARSFAPSKAPPFFSNKRDSTILFTTRFFVGMADNSEGTHHLGKDVFDFFGLPRELRNEIYSLLTETKNPRIARKEGDLHPTKAFIKAAPFNKLFTLCHQFKTEYEETFKDGLQITFQDVGGQTEAPKINEDLDKVTKAEFLLIAFCGDPMCAETWCSAADDMMSHVEAIRATVRALKNLCDLQVKIYQCQYRDSSETNIQPHRAMEVGTELNTLVEISSLSRLEVFSFLDVYDGCEAKDGVVAYETAQVPGMVWTKEHDWEKGEDLLICSPSEDDW